MVKALAWAGAAAALTKVTGPLLQAAGRPELQVRASVQETLVLAVLLYPLTRVFGISGAALAVLIASLWLLAVQGVLVARLFGSIGRDVLRVMKAGLLCSSPFLVAAPLVPLSEKAIIVTPFMLLDGHVTPLVVEPAVLMFTEPPWT